MNFPQIAAAVISLILAYVASNSNSTDTAIFLATTLIIVAFGRKDKPE